MSKEVDRERAEWSLATVGLGDGAQVPSPTDVGSALLVDDPGSASPDHRSPYQPTLATIHGTRGWYSKQRVISNSLQLREPAPTAQVFRSFDEGEGAGAWGRLEHQRTGNLAPGHAVRPEASED